MCVGQDYEFDQGDGQLQILTTELVDESLPGLQLQTAYRSRGSCDGTPRRHVYVTQALCAMSRWLLGFDPFQARTHSGI